MDVPYWTLALLRSAILYSRGTILRNSMRVIWCVVLSFSDLCVLHANAFMCIVAAPLRELCECPDIPSMSSILTRNFFTDRFYSRNAHRGNEHVDCSSFHADRGQSYFCRCPQNSSNRSSMSRYKIHRLAQHQSCSLPMSLCRRCLRRALHQPWNVGWQYEDEWFKCGDISR